MDFEFDTAGDECFGDLSYMDDEFFGFAKSISSAPMGIIAPGLTLESQEKPDVEKEAEEVAQTEIKAEGFCFKLHPAEDQVQFQRDLKTLAPKMTDFAEGTTTLAFEF